MLMKTGQVAVVILNPREHLEQENIPDKDSPARREHVGIRSMNSQHNQIINQHFELHPLIILIIALPSTIKLILSHSQSIVAGDELL